ncbi:MAG: nitronate monooxygenase [Pyrinomonadaceae bacterium]|nr:nitronate monooxygenase [Pyrinomonadaceae bacterium]
MLDSNFTRLIGIRYPIVQAPIGSATTAELAAAVSNAGALGTLALTWRPLDVYREGFTPKAGQTSMPINIHVGNKEDSGSRRSPLFRGKPACGDVLGM